jgi:hypothetical protein
MQSATKGTNGANSQGTAVYEYLKQHGYILSNNPLLAQLNPKYPTDAVWTNCAVRMRETLAADGFVIVAIGRKPTTYKLVQLASVAKQSAKQPKQPKPTAQPTETPVGESVAA